MGNHCSVVSTPSPHLVRLCGFDGKEGWHFEKVRTKESSRVVNSSFFESAVQVPRGSMCGRSSNLALRPKFYEVQIGRSR